MLIDTHCHLDFPDFDTDRDACLARAAAAGIKTMINVASSLKASRDAVRLAQSFDSVYASVGIHPHDAKDFSPQGLAEIKELAAQPKVVAIGEVGLDFYRNLSEPQAQTGTFREFIALALEARLPLIVHSRLAQDETLAILKEYPDLTSSGVVIHCFSGDMEFLKTCLERGYFVSFTCNATYKKADAIRQSIRYVSLDRMFLETDAPFLAPEGKRGKRNEPAYLVELAQEVSRIKGVDFETVCAETTKNARQFFKIDRS
jgi:TatD DNase family protein